jgi:hypothetical protein
MKILFIGLFQRPQNGTLVLLEADVLGKLL